MKVIMKQLEAWCLEENERYNKKGAWDNFCIAKDSYLAGFKKARHQIASKLLEDNDMSIFNQRWTDSENDEQRLTDEQHENFIKYYVDLYVKKLGEDEVEVELDGNQIGGKNGQ